MSFLQTYAKEIFSVCVPLVTAIVRFFTRARVKLTYAMPHGFTYIVQEPLQDPQGTVVASTQKVVTQSFYFRNEGRATAHHIELVFNWKPKTINIWPVRHFTEHIEADGRYVMIFETLAPGELFGCELLTVNAESPNLITFRCDEETGTKVAMYPQRVVSKSLVRLGTGLMLLGFATAIYLLLVCLQWVVLKTPVIF